LTGLLLLYGAVQFAFVLGYGARMGYVGGDAERFISSATRWATGGSFYFPVQLAGRYVPSGDVMLYPPLAIYLFLPFAILPRVLWWAIPLAIIAGTLWRLRPAYWCSLILAAIWCLVPTQAGLMSGNANMWMTAFVALAVWRRPAAVALLMKPTVFPIALLFARDRRWWLGLSLAGLAAIPFGRLWLDYATITRNLDAPLSYSADAYPMLLSPLIAYLARRRDATLDGPAEGSRSCFGRARPAPRLGMVGRPRSG
jgi:hypothetical protein